MKVNKGDFSYIKEKKKKHLLGVLIYALIGVAIFICGLLITKVKANIFTVIGILMVLPAAKHCVAFIVLMPYKSVTKDKYDEVNRDKKACETLLADCVITSTEKVMNLDYLSICSGKVLGLIGRGKQDVSYIRTYLGKGIHNYAPDYDVELVEDYETFKELHRNLPVEDIDEEEEKRVIDFINSLIVS